MRTRSPLPLIALVGATGCDIVFGVDPPPEVIVDAPPDAPPCAVPVQTATANAAETASIAQGANTDTSQTVAWLESKGPRRALWKFGVPGAVVGRPILAMRLILPHMPQHMVCGMTGQCEPCGSIEQAGAIDVYPIVVTWNTAASWRCPRMPGFCGEWDGASGTSRGARIGTGIREVAQATSVDIVDIDGAFSLGEGGQIALLAQAADESGSGASAVMPGVIEVGGSCVFGERVRIELDYCPP